LRDYRLYFLDVLEAIRKISKYTSQKKFETFIKDDMAVDAVVRNLEVIGEAVKHIPEKVKQDYPDVEWREIAGMRDKLTHDYFGVDYELVWKAIAKEIPELEKKVKDILDKVGMPKSP